MSVFLHLPQSPDLALLISLCHLISQGYDQWLLSWPAQAILLTSALVWCRDVTEMYKVGGPLV